MATVLFKGSVVTLNGVLPPIGSKAPDFSLCAGDLSEKSLNTFIGMKKILNIVPSLDTGICATSTRKFNEYTSRLTNTVVLVISADLPFAQKRFCEIEGLKHVVALSTFRSDFAEKYGLKMANGPFRGLCARCVMIMDEDNTILYRELVPEIAQEPDYDSALAVIK